MQSIYLSLWYQESVVEVALANKCHNNLNTEIPRCERLQPEDGIWNGQYLTIIINQLCLVISQNLPSYPTATALIYPLLFVTQIMNRSSKCLSSLIPFLFVARVFCAKTRIWSCHIPAFRPYIPASGLLGLQIKPTFSTWHLSSHMTQVSWSGIAVNLYAEV